MKKKTIHEKNLPDMPAFAQVAMKKKDMRRINLARKLGWSPSAVSLLFNRRNWSMAELKMVGNALDHDMYQYLYPAPPEGTVPAALVHEATKEIADLKEELKNTKAELLVLQGKYDLLKELMEKRG